MKRTQLYFLFFLVCISTELFAQESSSQKAVTAYIDYVNHCSRLLQFSHEKMGYWNRSINDFVDEYDAENEEALSAKHGMHLKIWYGINNPGPEEHFLIDEKNAMVVREALWADAMSQTENIPELYREKLKGRIEKTKLLTDNYLEMVKSLEELTQHHNYLNRDALPGLYKYLDRYSLHCFDFSAIKYLMDQELKAAYNQTFRQPDLDLLQDNVANTLELILAMRRNDRKESMVYFDKVYNLITDTAFVNRLKGLWTDKGFDIEKWESSKYLAVLDGSEYILEQADFFMQGQKTWSDDLAFYDEYSDSYFYAEKAVHYYNCPKGGVASFYNDVITLETEPMVKMLEEPMWFEVIYRKLEEEVEDLEMNQEELPVAESGLKHRDPTIVTLDGFASNNMVFLLDVSSSMNSPDKLPLLKEAFGYLLNLMRPEDHVSIVQYSSSAEVILPNTSAVNKEVINTAINGLTYGGKTNSMEALIKAYNHANEHFIAEGNNRIILATDGKFEVDRRMQKIIKRNALKGVQLTVFCFGARTYASVRENLRGITKIGGGNFAHIKENDGAFSALVQEAQAIRK